MPTPEFSEPASTNSIEIATTREPSLPTAPTASMLPRASAGPGRRNQSGTQELHPDGPHEELSDLEQSQQRHPQDQQQSEQLQANSNQPHNLSSTQNGAATTPHTKIVANHSTPAPTAHPAAHRTPQSAVPRIVRPFFRHRHAQKSANTSPKPWRSCVHQSWSLALLIGITLGIIFAIVALCIISSKNQGIHDVTVSSKPILGIHLGLSITWTTVPAVIFGSYNFWTTSVVHNLARRQPYVALREDERGALASDSLMLDYAALNTFTAPYQAFKRNHILLCFSLILQLVFSLVIPGLASSLLTPAAVTFQDSVVVQPLTNFSDSGFTATSSVTGILDIASSTQIYGGNLPPFVDTFIYFANFSDPDRPAGAAGASNFTVDAFAYRVEVGCESVPSSDFSFTSGNGSLSFNATDRGCELSGDFAGPARSSSPFNNFTYYLQTLYTACGVEAEGSRVAAIGAINTPSGLTNETVISCNTSYYSSHADLTVGLDPSIRSDPVIQKYDITGSTLFDPRPLFADLFERSLPEPLAADPTAVLSANDFGRLIFTYAQTYHPDTFMTADPIKNATIQIFGTAFPLMAKQYLIRPIPTSEGQQQQLHGTLSTIRTRLLVVQAVAYTLLGLLALKIVTTACTWWYVHNHPAALYEEPQGLLVAARMLKKSALMEKVEETFANDRSTTQDGAASLNVWKVWEKDANLAGSRWKWENWSQPKIAKLAHVS